MLNMESVFIRRDNAYFNCKTRYSQFFNNQNSYPCGCCSAVLHTSCNLTTVQLTNVINLTIVQLTNFIKT